MFNKGKSSLDNVYHWGEIYESPFDRWKDMYNQHLENGIWNGICIRCNKNTGKCKGWRWCDKCYDEYQKFISSYRKKGYNLFNLNNVNKIRSIGYEIIGSKNVKQDDYEIIQSSIKTVQKIIKTKLIIEVGNIKLFNLFLNKLKLPKRWKLRLSRHFWRKSYFESLLKRLETNYDIDPLAVEVDKKRYKQMKSENQKQIVAGRKISEILNRFNNKVKDPR